MASATHLLFLFSFHTLLVFHGSAETVGDDTRTANFGTIIDANSRIRKEVKTAMELAIQSFNHFNNQYKISFHVRDSGGDPLQSTSAAKELIEKQQVDAILGMEAWQEAALVAEAGNQAQVPVFSFASTSLAASLTTKRWPFLVRMNDDETTKMECVAAIVGAYKWRNVVVIYEDDTYGSNSGMAMLLSDALRNVISQVEYRMTFPPISSLSNPKYEISEKLGKLKRKHFSSVYILIQPSVSFAIHLFREARNIGLMESESVWITTNSLDSFDSSVKISSMQGVLGIKTYFSRSSSSFKHFSSKFKKKFHSEYPEEKKFEPGIHAVRAYDAISTLTRAMNNRNSTTTSKVLLDEILSTNFRGLSGKIQFRDGELLNFPIFQIVNVVGKSYNKLDFWTPECNFSKSLGDRLHRCDHGTSYRTEGLGGTVEWPGGLQGVVPRGKIMPLKIGFPGITALKEIVGVEQGNDKSKPTGFCIDVFNETLKILNQNISYVFEQFDGSYDDLVQKVYHKEYDAVVGDISILADRSNYVKFTHPFIESGLSLIVPVNKTSQAWMFMMPFTSDMWITICLFWLYTTLVVWFVEHPSNKEFRGPWKDQLGTALWFTFSTFFFAHREKIHSNFSRFVMVIWLFVVLILNSSYTASRTSMLTVQRLKPTMSEVEILKKNNLTVGCDKDTFAKKYLVDVLGFRKDKIMDIASEDDYVSEFERGNIMAAFLELPDAKVFLHKNGNKYTSSAQPIYRFGGWGFVFPLGSALAANFSNAILELLEKGNITELENLWFCGGTNCSKSGTEVDNESLGLDSFSGLFVLTTGTSTIVFLLFLLNLWMKYRLLQGMSAGNMSSSNGSWWHQVKTFLHQKGQRHLSVGTPASAQIADIEDRVSVPPHCEYPSEYNNLVSHQASRIAQIEMQNTSTADV